MSTLHVFAGGVHVADIANVGDSQSGLWVLTYKAGRKERFGFQSEAKDEARKTWGACQFLKRLPT